MNVMFAATKQVISINAHQCHHHLTAKRYPADNKIKHKLLHEPTNSVLRLPQCSTQREELLHVNNYISATLFYILYSVFSHKHEQNQNITEVKLKVTVILQTSPQ